MVFIAHYDSFRLMSTNGHLKESGFKPFNPHSLTQRDLERGKEEFITFATQTYKGLVEREERELRTKSGLRLFR